MSSLRNVLHQGFPVTARLGELPGFVDFTEAHGLRGGARARLADWLVVVDAELIDLGASFEALFESYAGRSGDEVLEPEADLLLAA